MNSSKREKRPRESSESNKSFVKNVTSRMSGLLPSTITKWFSSPSSSNTNGSATVVDASDSSTEDEAPDSPTMGQPPSKCMRLSPSSSKHYIGIHTKSSSTNTDSADFIQNNILNSPSIFLKKDSNFSPTPIIKKSDESTTKTSETENSVSYILKNSLSSGDTSVMKTRKSLFNSLSIDKNYKKEDNSYSDTKRHSYNKSSLLGSPFYPGQTTYGGAASTSYLKNSNIYQNKNTVVNETNTNESLNVSHSARRIMDLLENYSSPLTEAKRISQYVKSENSINTSMNTSSSNPDCKKVISYKTQELHVPSIASILSIKRRSRLMATTSAARQLIASHSSSATPYPASKSNPQKKDTSSKLVTKMKTTVHEKQSPILTTVPLNLPTAVLQIDKDNLPKFSFQSLVSQPKDTKSSTTVPLTSSNTKTVMCTTQSENVRPHVLISSEQCKSPPNNTCYPFSKPVTVSNDTVTSQKLPVFTFISPEKHVDLKKHEDCTKNDSVSSIVDKKQERDTVSKNLKDWKCNDCWVSNKPHVDKCVCCGGKKPEINGNKMCTICKEAIPSDSLDVCSKCKKVQDEKRDSKVSDSAKWKCQDCWVSNDSDKDKCVCCGGKKPVKSAEVPKVESTSLMKQADDSKWKCEDCWVSNDYKNEKCVCCGGKKLVKQPEASKQGSSDKGWKCSVCLLENGNNDVKCVACLTAKPTSNTTNKPVNNDSSPNFMAGNNSLQDIVKSQSQKWECPFCLVHNENTKSQCVCCDSERPGAPKQKETKFNFGLSSSTMFKFGINSTEKEKIEEKKPEVKETNNNILPKTSFTFGIPATNTETVTSKEADKTYDAPVPAAAPVPAFSFGIPKEVQNKSQINIDNSNLSTTKSPISASTSESGKIEKPQEVPNVDGTNSEAHKPKLQFSSTLFSTPISQPSLNKPTTTAPITQSFNSTSTVSTIPKENNELKTNYVPVTSAMSITNFFTSSTSTPNESIGATMKPTETPTLNSNITLFQKSEPAKTVINFTAPPLFQKNEDQQPATSTPLFTKLEPQSTLNTVLSPFKKSEANATAASSLFQKSEPVVTTSVSLFSTGSFQMASTQSLFPKSETTATSQNATTSAPIFSFGTNSQTAPTQQTTTEKPKFNFTFGNSNKIGANMFTNSNTSTPTFGGISDSNVNKFGAPAGSAGATNMFSNNTSGNALSSGNILGGNGLGATLGNNNLSSINTGNTLQSNMQLPIAQGTGIFGATQKENSTWPTSNNAMQNIFSTTASTNAVQKPAAFSFGNSNLSFNMNNNSNVPVFGSNTMPSQNVFSHSNSNTNNASPFSNPVQNQAVPTMFGSPQPSSNPAPAVGLFGQQNVQSAFGSTNTSTFEVPQNSLPTPAFNFGSPQPSAVFGFGQAQAQQQQTQQQGGVYSFGSAGPGQVAAQAQGQPQVQFAVGSAPGSVSGNVRRVKKVVRRTTQR